MCPACALITHRVAEEIRAPVQRLRWQRRHCSERQSRTTTNKKPHGTKHFLQGATRVISTTVLSQAKPKMEPIQVSSPVRHAVSYPSCIASYKPGSTINLIDPVSPEAERDNGLSYHTDRPWIHKPLGRPGFPRPPQVGRHRPPCADALERLYQQMGNECAIQMDACAHFSFTHTHHRSRGRSTAARHSQKPTGTTKSDTHSFVSVLCAQRTGVGNLVALKKTMRVFVCICTDAFS